MIEMVAGVFGLPVKGIVKAMDKDSGPFTASAEQEARLVNLGLAKYVGEPVEAPEKEQQEELDADIGPIGFDETPPDPEELPEGVTGIPEYSMENTKKELLEIAEMCGLDVDSRMTKAEIIDALDAHIEANMVDGVEVDDDGEITVDDGEPEPTFDASQAVQ